MGWEVKNDMRGQAKHGLKSNIKILAGCCQRYISGNFWVTVCGLNQFKLFWKVLQVTMLITVLITFVPIPTRSR